MKVNKAGLHYGILIIVILIAVYMGMEWYKKEEDMSGAGTPWQSIMCYMLSQPQRKKCMQKHS